MHECQDPCYPVFPAQRRNQCYGNTLTTPYNWGRSSSPSSFWSPLITCKQTMWSVNTPDNSAEMQVSSVQLYTDAARRGNHDSDTQPCFQTKNLCVCSASICYVHSSKQGFLCPVGCVEDPPFPCRTCVCWWSSQEMFKHRSSPCRMRPALTAFPSLTMPFLGNSSSPAVLGSPAQGWDIHQAPCCFAGSVQL